MSTHDFTELVAHYPAVIAQMPPRFGAHEFILRLAHQHQHLYIEALHAYKDRPAADEETPFLIVHRRLAKFLGDFPGLVAYKGQATSDDIFGHKSECSQWRRV
jgi:hypothetical protein